MRLDGVGKRYGTRLPWVLRDVSLEIRPGRLVRLEGRNGSGKSTLLKMIAGVCEPSRGTVTGRPITGYVPERFPPSLPFSARDYLSHIGRVHGLAGGDLAERIQACLDRLGGWEFADVPLRNMSKGMCQKVAVAQALLPSAGLLVLDEAWTGLDVEAKAALDEVVAERIAEGGSVVFVDHDPNRLAGLDAERWRIADSRARRVAAAGAAVAGSAGSGAGQEPVSAPVSAEAAETGPQPPPQVTKAAAAQTKPRPVLTEPAAAVAAEPAEADVDPASAGLPAEAAALAAEPGAAVIVVAGYPPGAADPVRLPGVRSASRDGDRVSVAAEPGTSDRVLRTLLGAGDSVHVLSVRTAPGQPGGER